jgi:rhodanese-related sulfurtransferase
MNTREKFSVGMIGFGLILALLPLPSNPSFSVKPDLLQKAALDEKTYVTVDQVARFMVSEDSTILLIDLRPQAEFNKINIPGSINIPYAGLLNNDLNKLLNKPGIRSIFYANDDLFSNYAVVLTRGRKFTNTYAMHGGLNEWFATVMNSSFTGEKISARENALFETRSRARQMFNEINSLPDSLKLKYSASKRMAAKKLDGGCE